MFKQLYNKLKFHHIGCSIHNIVLTFTMKFTYESFFGFNAVERFEISYSYLYMCILKVNEPLERNKAKLDTSSG